MRMNWPGPTLLLGVLAACGPGSGNGDTTSSATSSDASSGSTSSETSTSVSTTGASDAGSGTTTTTTTSDSATTGPDDQCVDDYGPTVPVTIRNDSSEPRYLAIDSCNMAVQLSKVALPGETPIAAPGICWTCQGAKNGSCVCPGPPCWIGAALRLDPGAQWETAISATEYVSREVTDCGVPVGTECGMECFQPTPLGDGDYEVRVTASDAIACTSPPCDCTPGVDGTCWVEAEGDLEAGTVVGAPFAMPDPQPVTISLQ